VDDEKPEEETEDVPSEMTMVTDLPNVITADMLRKRKASAVDLEDIEIPAELLVGLEEGDESGDTWEQDEEAGGERERGKRRRAKTEKRSRKKRRTAEDDDEELSGYYR
jgi:hypothetical protein